MPTDADKSAALMLEDAIATTASLKPFLHQVVTLSDLVLRCFENKKKLLFCGNGGSASDANHIAAEFTGRFNRERAPYPALALSADAGLLTCTANDYGFDEIFSRPIQAHGEASDILFCLTTSGNSANILAALAAARAKGIYSVALLGKGGGACKGVADEEFIIASNVTARIQEAHKLILHMICELVDCELA
ncbi:MAG: phosphoheptose isomerase [Rhodothermales bacterium]|jgi:phosphoheptose isomerase